MKKNLFFALLLSLLTLGAFSYHFHTTEALGFGDSPMDETPGNLFESTDPCGYLMGTSTPYGVGSASRYINASSMANKNQACVDANGNFYSSSVLGSTRDSQVYISNGSGILYTVDLVGSTYQVSIDQTATDRTQAPWSGFGYITDASFTGTNRWVWFDWECGISYGTSGGSDPYASASASCAPKHSVTSDLDAGTVKGYAWNDSLGFLSFRGLTFELPPQYVDVYADILANDTELGVDDVTYETSPLADGYEYWRVRLQFADSATGQLLDASDFTDVAFETPTTTGTVYLDQVENRSDAIHMNALNDSLGCSDATLNACPLVETVETGYSSWSENLFIYSYSPTSNRIGMDLNGDGTVEYPTDREGCRWIYYLQWKYVDGETIQEDCPEGSGDTYSREDVFYKRETMRNVFGLQAIFFSLDFAESGVRDIVVNVDDQLLQVASDQWVYIPTYTGDADGDGFNEGAYVSFRPRYRVTDWAAVYDGEDHTNFSEDTDVTMSLRVGASIEATSAAYQAADAANKPYPKIDVYHQTALEDPAVPSDDDQYLTFDDDQYLTFDDPVLGACSYTQESTYGSATFSNSYTVAYSQQDLNCQNGTAPVAAATNSISAPTVEEWVCDHSRIEVSCYYTAYLSLLDRYADPEDMLVIGAVNSTLGVEEVVSEDYISVLGSTDTIKLRNKMYAQVLRYTLGRTATGGVLNSSMGVAAGTIVSLMNGRLLFANGDVHITGSSAFSDKTLVVIGGNVYIDGDITNGRLGVVAFRSNGVGGNVYVAPTVSDLYANFFLDGALYSYDGSSDFTAEPTWASTETREDSLRTQLYLNGSLVARNTVNGSVDTDGDGNYELGDGTKVSGTDGYKEAREHDLNVIRSYSLCYPLDSSGVPDSAATPVECGEGTISSYGSSQEIYSPFILDYAPADHLPIFNVQAGLFQ